MQATQIVGYLAMAFLVISFIPQQIRLIRSLNFLACCLFIVYGIFLGWEWPVIISNAFVAVIQLYHLFIRKKQFNAGE